MPKLIDETVGVSVPIGKQGLLTAIDEMNSKRALLRISERYKPAHFDGVLGMAIDEKQYRDGSPSPTYAAPRLVHST